MAASYVDVHLLVLLKPDCSRSTSLTLFLMENERYVLSVATPAKVSGVHVFAHTVPTAMLAFALETALENIILSLFTSSIGVNTFIHTLLF